MSLAKPKGGAANDYVMKKDEDYRRMIHTVKWLKLRRDVLTAHPICQRCHNAAACEVHHVQPVEDALTAGEKRARMYDPHNLQALCHACHVEVHTYMGRGGKAAAKRRAAEQSAEAIRKLFGDE